MYLNNENKISKQNIRNRNIVQYKHTPATIRQSKSNKFTK